MIRKHFKTKGFIDGGAVINNNGEEVDLSLLPPFLRTLLVTDGTVTKSLEAFYWEPIKVVSITQELVQKTNRRTVFDEDEVGQFLHHIYKPLLLDGQLCQD